MLEEMVEIIKWLWPVSWLMISVRYYYEVIRDKDWTWMDKRHWFFAITFPIISTFVVSVFGALLVTMLRRLS